MCPSPLNEFLNSLQCWPLETWRKTKKVEKTWKKKKNSIGSRTSYWLRLNLCSCAFASTFKTTSAPSKLSHAYDTQLRNQNLKNHTCFICLCIVFDLENKIFKIPQRHHIYFIIMRILLKNSFKGSIQTRTT